MSDAFNAHNELKHRIKVSDKLAAEIVEILRTSLAPAVGKALTGAEEAGCVKERRRCLEIVQAGINAAIDAGETSLYWGRLADVKASIVSGHSAKK